MLSDEVMQALLWFAGAFVIVYAITPKPKQKATRGGNQRGG